MIESLLMAVGIWLIHAALGGLPLLHPLIRGSGPRWQPVTSLCLILPFGLLIAAQHFWPVGGASSFLVRLVILTGVVFAASLLSVAAHLRPARGQLIVLGATVAVVIPIQLLVPSLPD